MRVILRIALVFTFILASIYLTRARIADFLTTHNIFASSEELSSEELPSNKSAPLVSFLAWRDANGLAKIFSFISEKYEPDKSYLMILNADYTPEQVMGSDAEHDLYRKLFVKIVGFSGLSLDQVELQIRTAQGYCDPPVVQNSLRFEDGTIRITQETYSEGGSFDCMLNFEGIKRNEAEKQTAIRLAFKNISMPMTNSAADGLTIEKIKQYFQQRYIKNEGNITITSNNDNFYAMTVRQIQGEVIKGKRFWERLQIIVQLEKVSEGTKIIFILDGKYASGLAAPRDDLAYSDMEPIYTGYLNDYGKSLLIAMNEIK